MLFAHRRMIKDLLRGFIDSPWIHEVDFDTLEQLPSQFITGQVGHAFEERISDLIWRVEWTPAPERGLGNQPRQLHIILLLELQSTSTRDMALRLWTYTALSYQRLWKDHKISGLPPIVPIVLYNGSRRWTAPRNVSQLIGPAPEELRALLPAQSYLLIDEKRWDGGEFDQAENVVAAVFRLARCGDAKEFSRILADLKHWLDRTEQDALRRDLTAWLRKVVLPELLPGVDIPDVERLDDFYTLMEVNMPAWTEQWYAEGFDAGVLKGEAKGEIRGQARILLHQLRLRFGPLEASVTQKVRNGSSDEILQWAEALLTVETLDDLFGHH